MILTCIPTVILAILLVFTASSALLAVRMWMHNEKAAEDSREENTALRLELEGKEYEVSSLKAKLSFHELQKSETAAKQ